jgi:hypothetical protein
LRGEGWGEGFVKNSEGFVKNSEGFVKNSEGFVKNSEGFVKNSKGEFKIKKSPFFIFFCFLNVSSFSSKKIHARDCVATAPNPALH